MPDQATVLRHWIRRMSAEPPRASTLQFIAVAGAKGGVGATTVAVQLAIELARTGQRTVLVDVDLDGGDVASLCPLSDGPYEGLRGIADVLTSRRGVHEVLHRGPLGLQVIPGTWQLEHHDAYSEASLERLIRLLRELEGFADRIVLDVGRATSPVGHRFCEAADRVLVVTTPDDTSVMDAYAAIKILHANHGAEALQVVVNRSVDDERTRQVHERLATTCRRFLGINLPGGSQIAEEPQWTAPESLGHAAATKGTWTPAARDVEKLASQLVATRVTRGVPAPHLPNVGTGELGPTRDLN